MGLRGGGLSRYSVYSWPSFVKVKARLGQVCDLARFGQVGDQIVRSRTRLVKARARSLTIIVVCQAKISVYVLFII